MSFDCWRSVGMILCHFQLLNTLLSGMSFNLGRMLFRIGWDYFIVHSLCYFLFKCFVFLLGHIILFDILLNLRDLRFDEILLGALYWFAYVTIIGTEVCSILQNLLLRRLVSWLFMRNVSTLILTSTSLGLLFIGGQSRTTLC